MLPIYSSDPCDDDRQESALWKPCADTRNIFIPLEVNNSQTITGFVLLDDQALPEDGQKTLYEYAGSCFRENCASLTIHRELDHPTLEGGYTITLLKLAQSIDHCNVFSRNHAVRTAFWARHLAAEFGFSEEQLDQVELAGKLHDVGKVVVPKSVLGKPARLTEEEWEVVRRHPTFGALILQPSSWLHPLIPLVKAHHEKFDGSGYPLGIAGDQIPLGARLISVADTYTTMTEGRVYRLASSSLEAMSELQDCSGQQFDPDVVRVMVDMVASGKVDDSQTRWDS